MAYICSIISLSTSNLMKMLYNLDIIIFMSICDQIVIKKMSFEKIN